jgi:hypothetical protein
MQTNFELAYKEYLSRFTVSDPQSTRFTTPFLSGMLARSE